ncbi:uncharacterized protein [Diadema antillarum]|uniref:uncharacterized protein n=1 Tax=Diadema antillarum TaxID=105358 RepID=UPI003A8B291B
MELEKYIQLGKDCGLQGAELVEFARTERDKYLEEKRRDEKLERDERQVQREEITKQKRIELEIAQYRSVNVKGTNSVRNSLPSLPAFRADSDDLDAYLLRFERYAKQSQWPEECWAPALGNLLTGRALEVYSLLPANEADDYESLKDTLLRQFALTEEGFRKRFREARQKMGESFGQFATRITGYATRWVEMSGTSKSYEGLLELTVREQLLECCDRGLSVFIRERNPRSVKEMADIADRYRDAHGHGGSGKRARDDNKSRNQGNEASQAKKGGATSRDNQGCFVCGKQGHFASKCPDRKTDQSKITNKQYVPKSKQTGATCVVGVCPTHDAHERGNVSGTPSVKLMCGHELPLLSGGCNVGTDMPTCEGMLNGKRVKVLRDTGCNTVVVKRQLIEESQLTGEIQTCVLIDGTVRKVPLAKVEIDSPYFVGTTHALCMTNAIYDLIIGNVSGARQPGDEDIGWSGEDAREKPSAEEMTTSGSEAESAEAGSSKGTTQNGITTTSDSRDRPHTDESVKQTPTPLPTTNESAAVETRGMRKSKERPWKRLGSADQPTITATREEMIRDQARDATLEKLRKFAEKGEAKAVGKGSEVRYFCRDNLLFREYRSPYVERGKTFTQLVVPQPYRSEVLRLAHDSPLAGHLQTKKTADRILAHFYWPGIQADVKRYCASCDSCQRTTSKGKIGKVPLTIPPLIDTCFRRVAVDLIGPLEPITERGNLYILTIIDLATRYPEAVALPRIEAKWVAEALVEVFSRLGIPNEILSDNGTQFVSGVMKEAAQLLGVKQFHTTPYHPMANGACERFNGTLKQMLRRMCQERPRDWDRFLPALLFAYRELPHESLGFSPFELMYGRVVRGPMTVLKELWTKEIPEEETKTTYQYVIDLQNRLEQTCELAKEELSKASRKYKKHFDVKTKERRFECGDKVLLLLPTTRNKLQMQWRGPFEIVQRIARDDYRLLVNGKERTYHANLLKRYIGREDEKVDDLENENQGQLEANYVSVVDDQVDDDGSVPLSFPSIEASESVHDVKCSDELDEEKMKEVKSLLLEFSDVMTDVPGRTDIIEHAIELKTNEPIRSRPYPVPRSLKETIREEVNTMLRMGVIERSTSPYASPVVLVKKKDGKNRFCVDYRKLNAKTVVDNEPIPNIEELMAEIGNAKFFTKIDLAKGYWQIPVVEEDRKKTAFVTPDGQYEFKVLPFGLVNAPAVFTRMMRALLEGLPHVVHYIDDILIYSSSWEEHLNDIRQVCLRLRQAHLTARPTKCHVACKSVEFLGHIVGQGKMKPTPEQIQKVMATTRPTTKKEVRAFLGLVGYYRKFIPNMSTIAAPLTDATKKNEPDKIRWDESHEQAFCTLRDRLVDFPILRLPDDDKEFVLRTDASDVGLGAVLMQESEGKYFPISYASRKLLQRERVYPIVERECLALAWAVRKFSYFLYGRAFQLQTDHYPLAYLTHARMQNPRVMRWALALQAYQYRVQVIKGSENVGADYLSRCPTE